MLRLIHVEDMEYKEDEEFNFLKTQASGAAAWPWIGMPSGVYIPNPGMSVWIFTLLARLYRATEPTQLATAVQLCALAGIGLLIPFTLKFVAEKEREPWLWATVLAAVNPFAVLYSRKLWPEPCLLPFCVITLMGFWRREKFWGAITWGLFAAVLGQIHMSGYFLAAGFWIWTLIWDRKKTNWKGWGLGTLLGALPLIPWLHSILTHPAGGRVSSGWTEAIQFKYFVFWITDPLGLHLGNPLGLLRGSGLAQIEDFIRYPIVGGVPTYGVGLAHSVIAAAAAFILGKSLLAFARGLRRTWKIYPKMQGSKWTKLSHIRELFRFNDIVAPARTQTVFAILASVIVCGLLLTVTGVNIRRYYMVVTFPLEFVTLALLALRLPRGRCFLAAIWAAELAISAGFVHYIHVNQGAIEGDYGQAYHLIKKLNRPPTPLAR